MVWFRNESPKIGCERIYHCAKKCSIETDTNINFSSSEIILGTTSDIPPIFDLYLTIAKMHIYCCKFQNIVPSIEGFAKRIADIKHIAKYIAVKNNKIQAFNQKWLISDPTAL